MAVMTFPGTGASLHFEWVPEDPIIEAKRFLNAAGYLEDTYPVIVASVGPAIESMQRRFDSKTDPGGGAWAEWSYSYAPVAILYGGTLGERDGGTRAYATSRAAYRTLPHELFFSGDGLPKQGVWLQQGTGPKRGGSSSEGLAEFVQRAQELGLEVDTEALGSGGGSQPSRPFIGLDEAAQYEVAEIFDEWVSGAVAIIAIGGGEYFSSSRFADPVSKRFIKR